VQTKRDAKLAASVRMGNTFEAVARAWFAHWKGPRSPRHADYVIRRLKADVFPILGAKPIGDITAPQLLAMAKKVESRGALDIARRCWQTCGQIFEYALAHGAVERNPSKDVKPSVALKPRDKEHFARLEAKEMPELLRKIEAYPGSPYTRFAMQLMALTFVRTGELIGARWEEFDLDEPTADTERTARSQWTQRRSGPRRLRAVNRNPAGRARAPARFIQISIDWSRHAFIAHLPHPRHAIRGLRHPQGCDDRHRAVQRRHRDQGRLTVGR
jgi:integrase